jgi:hypothetical protein
VAATHSLLALAFVGHHHGDPRRWHERPAVTRRESPLPILVDMSFHFPSSTCGEPDRGCRAAGTSSRPDQRLAGCLCAPLLAAGPRYSLGPAHASARRSPAHTQSGACAASRSRPRRRGTTYAPCHRSGPGEALHEMLAVRRARQRRWRRLYVCPRVVGGCHVTGSSGLAARFRRAAGPSSRAEGVAATEARIDEEFPHNASKQRSTTCRR